MRLPGAVAIVAALAMVASCGGGSKPPPAATTAQSTATAAATAPVRTPIPGPTATATPAPDTIAGVRVEKLTWANPAWPDIGPTAVFYVSHGCYQCDGEWKNLVRYYIDKAGLQKEVLFTPPEGRYILHLAAADDGSDIYISVCSRGWCGPMGQMTLDAQTTISRSRDGGMSWTTFATLDGAARVHHVGETVLVSRAYFQVDGAAWRFEPNVEYPGGRVLTPPTGVNASTSTEAFVLRPGEVVWLNRGGNSLLNADGSKLLQVPTEPSSQIREVHMLGEDEDKLLVRWQRYTGGYETAADLFGVFGRDGKLQRVFANDRFQISSVSGSPSASSISFFTFVNVAVDAAYLQHTPAPGDNADSGRYSLPALIDFNRGEVMPIAGNFFQESRNDRNLVVAVGHGPFARVKTPGDCLNVRRRPEPGAPVVACVRDRVLMHVYAETLTGSDGRQWRAVETPAGERGWAAEEFIEWWMVPP